MIIITTIYTTIYTNIYTTTTSIYKKKKEESKEERRNLRLSRAWLLGLNLCIFMTTFFSISHYSHGFKKFYSQNDTR